MRRNNKKNKLKKLNQSLHVSQVEDKTKYLKEHGSSSNNNNPIISNIVKGKVVSIKPNSNQQIIYVDNRKNPRYISYMRPYDMTSYIMRNIIIVGILTVNIRLVLSSFFSEKEANPVDKFLCGATIISSLPFVYSLSPFDLIYQLTFSSLNAIMKIFIARKNISEISFFMNFSVSLLAASSNYNFIKALSRNKFKQEFVFDSPFLNLKSEQEFLDNFEKLVQNSKTKYEMLDRVNEIFTVLHFLLCCSSFVDIDLDKKNSDEYIKTNQTREINCQGLIKFINNPGYDLFLYHDPEDVLYRKSQKIYDFIHKAFKILRFHLADEFIYSDVKYIANMVYKSLNKRYKEDHFENILGVVKKGRELSSNLSEDIYKDSYKSYFQLNKYYMSHFRAYKDFKIFDNLILFYIIENYPERIKNRIIKNNETNFISFILHNFQKFVLNKQFYKDRGYKDIGYKDSFTHLGKNRNNLLGSRSQKKLNKDIMQVKDKDDHKKYLKIDLSEIIKGNLLIQKLCNGREIDIISSEKKQYLLQNKQKLFLILKDDNLLSKDQLSHKDKRKLYTEVRDIDLEVYISDEEFLNFCCDFFNLAQDLKNESCYVIDFAFDPRTFSSLSISLYQENCLVPIDINIVRYNEKNQESKLNLSSNVISDYFMGNNHKSYNRNYYQKRILKNMLHVLKKIVRDDIKDNLVDNLKLVFEHLYKKDNSSPGVSYKEFNLDILKSLIKDSIKGFYNNFYQEKFEENYIKIFKKLFVSCRYNKQLESSIEFYEELKKYCKTNNIGENLINQIDLYLASQNWFFCKSIILNQNIEIIKKNNYENDFYWDLLDLGLSPVYLSKFFDIKKDPGFNKILSGYWSNKYQTELLDFFVVLSDYFNLSNKLISRNDASSTQCDAHSSLPVFSAVAASASDISNKVLFSNITDIMQSMDEALRDYCKSHKLIMHMNNASKILSKNIPDNTQEDEDFSLHISCIKKAYDSDQELFLKAFSCLLKYCENEKLSDFKKLIKECKEMISAHTLVRVNGLC